MAAQTLKFRIKGVSALLSHNGQLANPLNEFSKKIKQISSKRSKTEADFEEMARLEWHGGLYLMDGKPCIPGEVLEATLISAARKNKRGKQAQAGILCPGNYPITYDGPTDLDTMWADPRFRLTVGARVQKSRIMRTRPIFREWSAEIEVMYDPAMLNKSEVESIVRIAGEDIGLMDWRPKFGRFVVMTD